MVCVCVCVCVCVTSSVKWLPRGTKQEEVLCFTRRLHPKDAKPVPEGQKGPSNSNGLELRSFRKGRGRQREPDGGANFGHHPRA